MVHQLPAIIVVVPLFASFFVFFFGWRNKQLAFTIAMGGLSVCVVSAVIILDTVFRQGAIHYRLGGWAPPLGIEYRADHLTAFMLSDDPQIGRAHV